MATDNTPYLLLSLAIAVCCCGTVLVGLGIGGFFFWRSQQNPPANSGPTV
jgi:hypothetical protein